MSARDRRPRVLMMIDRLDWDPGGAERLVVALATQIPRDRFDVRLCTTRAQEGPLLDQVRSAGIPHFTLGRTTRLDVMAWRRLASYLRREKIDVLHTHMFGSNVSGSVIGKLARVPVIVAHEHSWSFEGRPLRRLLDGQLVGRLATVAAAGSAADRDRMIADEGIPPAKVVHIPGPYIARKRTGSEDLRDELTIDRQAPVVGTIASLRPQKTLHVLIDAFAAVSRSYPEAHLVLAGDGECRQALGQQVRDLSLEGRVHFLGQREDIAAVLDGIDVAAISSDYEGTSLFALECMAHRTPLVSTDVGGPHEFLENGVSAILVPRQNSAELAAAIKRLFSEPELRRSMAESAHAKLGEFELDRITERWADLYDGLLRERSG